MGVRYQDIRLSKVNKRRHSESWNLNEFDDFQRRLALKITVHCLQTDFPNCSGASTVVLGFFRQLTLSFSVIVDTSRAKKLAIFLGGH